jgi:hypothetical protein
LDFRRTIITLLSFLVMCAAPAAEGKRFQPAEQLSFSAEDDSVKNPVVIPRDVLAILSKDKLVREELENEGLPAEKIPSSWFSASAIHLSHANAAYLIVMSVGPVHGANTTMFWAFRPTHSGHDLIFTGGGHTLTAKNTRWNGYREIETLSVVMQKLATVVYRFDGTRYTRYKDKLEEIK